MENIQESWPAVSIQYPAFNFDFGPFKNLADSSLGIPLLVFFVSLFAFSIISLALLYHWLKYGKGSINRFFIIIAYFGGAFIFLGIAWFATLSI